MKLKDCIASLPPDIKNIHVINQDTAFITYMKVTQANKEAFLSEYGHASVRSRFINDAKKGCTIYISARPEVHDIVAMLIASKQYFDITKIILKDRFNNELTTVHWADDFDCGKYANWKVLSRRFEKDACIIRIERRKYYA